MTREITAKYFIIPGVMGLIAAALLLTDSMVAPLISLEPKLAHLPFGTRASFSWMAFVSWTFFFSCTGSERIKTVPCILLGFFAASLMVYLGTVLSGVIGFTIGNISVGLLLATFLITTAAMTLGNLRFLHLDNVNGIFYGLAMTFSQSIIGWDFGSLKLLAIIMIYGVIGLICGWLSNSALKKWGPSKVNNGAKA